MRFKSPIYLLGLCAALLSTRAGAHGQGFINFNNRVIGAVVAPIYGPEPANPTLALSGNATTNGGSTTYTGPLLAGTTNVAELWGGPLGAPEEELTLLSTVPFRTGSAAGFVAAPASVTVPGVAAGAVATVQVRSWNDHDGTISNWAAVLADTNVARGASPSFTAGPLGSNTVSAPRLTNFTSFNIHLPIPPPSRLLINEWLASNVTDEPPDPMDGDHDDWYEIYNPGPHVVDLSGYFLTDTLTNQSKFQIPAGYFVPAGGYLLVWADNELLQNTTNFPHLHVNFTLPIGGGTIGLYAPDGTAIDAITFGVQTTDVSEGRWPDGGTNRYFMASTTPGAANVVAPIITMQPQSQTNLVGSNVTFSVTAIGTSPLSYQWLFNGTNISGATNITYTIPSTLPADAGSYAVLVTNAYGLTASASAELRIVSINEGRLRCADGSPLAGCIVTVQFWAGSMLGGSYTATSDNTGRFFYYLSCTGVADMQEDRRFVITASCCPNQTWTVPSHCCCGDLGILECNNCVPPPTCDPTHNLLVNGSFEQPVIGSGTAAQLPNISFPNPVSGWTTACGPNGTGGLIELWRNPTTIPSSDGLQHLEINGNRDVQTVCQLVTVCADVEAALCFDYTGRFPSTNQNQFEVTVFDDSENLVWSSPSFSPAAFGSWQHYSAVFTPPTPTIRIQFKSTPDTTVEGGAHIDNVILTQAPQRPLSPCHVTNGTSFSTTFDNSPAGLNLYGNAVASPVSGNNALKLTTADNWQFGVAVLPALSVHSFRATFKLYIGGGGPRTGGIASADGFSFNLADDILPVSSSYGPSYEEGTGTGLTVSFDTYDNDLGGSADATGIFLRSGGSSTTPIDGTVFQPSQGSDVAAPGWADVEITLDDCGNAKVFYNGQLRAAGHVKYCPGPNARFALAARTGAGNDNHWVDDLVITPSNCAPEIAATAPAGSCFADVTYDTPCFTGCGNFTVVCAPPSGSAFCVGTTRVCCTATDTAGNQAHCGFGVTIPGVRTPPVFTLCPQSGDLGCHPLFVFPAPIATATCGTPVITSDEGTIITNGCHRSQTRIYTATDPCGNTATCPHTFTWTEDTTPPVIIRYAADRTLLVNAFLCSAQLPDMRSEGVAADNCSEVTVVQDPPGGTHLGDGTHEVVFTVCDACGNCVTYTNTVTVFSILLFCPADLTVDCQNDLGATVNYQIPTADSLCCGGPESVSCVPPPGHYSIGVTRVVCRATDGCGHAGQCSFTVTVRDNGCCHESGNLVNNGGFELPASAGGGGFLNNGSVPGWNGYAGACGSPMVAPIELWASGSILPQGGLQHLEISSSVSNETVCQVVNNLTPGCRARLCFWYTGRPGIDATTQGLFDNTFTVTLSGAYAFTAKLLPSAWPAPSPAVGGWDKYSVSFIPSGPSLTIAFGRNPTTTDVGGAHIDNVSLTQCCAPDSDHDGLPDVWEIAHGFNPNNPGDAGFDADGDRVTNVQEYLAGTDPNDPGSALGFRPVGFDPTGAVMIQFEAAPSHSYSVEAAPSLGGAWTAVESVPAQPAARIVTMTVPNAGEAARFFRVHAE